MTMFRRALLGAALMLCGTPAFAATCYVTEFSGGLRGTAQIAVQPPLAEQTVAIGGSAASSSAFSAGTNIIRLHCDAIASFKIGPAPVATTSSARTPADATEYFEVSPGDKLSVITNN